MIVSFDSITKIEEYYLIFKEAPMINKIITQFTSTQKTKLLI